MRRFFYLIVFLALKSFAAGSPPPNFHEVKAGLYRGGSLTQSNIEWLKEKGIKSIVKLDDENEAELSWGLPVVQMHINKFGFNLSYELVRKILTQIDEAEKRGPVYVHCEKGADRTGLIVGLYRIRSGWSIESARSEMNHPKFGHSRLQVWMDWKFESYGERIFKTREAAF